MMVEDQSCELFMMCGTHRLYKDNMNMVVNLYIAYLQHQYSYYDQQILVQPAVWDPGLRELQSRTSLLKIHVQ